ncbi:hypothetical protein [Streptomyces sp. NPDC050485]|uniref:hypothetical protein n=1 Tax=Streptomyces sp. NPDC050485 TaxID=3365617 RepID=UPI0037BB1F1A
MDDDWEERDGIDELDERQVREALECQYPLTVAKVEELPGADTSLRWRVLTNTGQHLFVKEWESHHHVPRTRVAADAAMHARAGLLKLPIPKVLSDRNRNLVSVTETGAWMVMEEAVLGQANPGPLSVAQAEHVGIMLSRLHWSLASYPQPAPARRPPWTCGVTKAVHHCDTLLTQTGSQTWAAQPQLAAQLEKRRHDLHQSADSLLSAIPDLPPQTLHGDFTRANRFVVTDVVQSIVGFAPGWGPRAWELAQAAFDPLTVTSRKNWAEIAVSLINAYRSERSGLTPAEVTAVPRLALLSALFDLDGAQPLGHYPPPADAARRTAWTLHHTAFQEISDHLSLLDEALAHPPG